MQTYAKLMIEVWAVVTVGNQACSFQRCKITYVSWPLALKIGGQVLKTAFSLNFKICFNLATLEFFIFIMGYSSMIYGLILCYGKKLLFFFLSILLVFFLCFKNAKLHY
jgi:hypothetical protein